MDCRLGNSQSLAIFFTLLERKQISPVQYIRHMEVQMRPDPVLF
jgi:hypothetical protein